MKKTTLLLGVLLLAFAPMAFAEENPAPAPEVTLPSADLPEGTVLASALVAPSSKTEADCGESTSPFVPMNWATSSQLKLNCGACSSSNCVGAPRGQMCWVGGGFGWGHCNIYTGGEICPTGGWECTCGIGPLP